MARTYIVDGKRFTMTEAEEAERDKEETIWNNGAVKRNAMAVIQRLESTITPRRLRDALANDAGKKWVADVEALIATERSKL
jgi:hypothetical protein